MRSHGITGGAVGRAQRRRTSSLFPGVWRRSAARHPLGGRNGESRNQGADAGRVPPRCTRAKFFEDRRSCGAHRREEAAPRCLRSPRPSPPVSRCSPAWSRLAGRTPARARRCGSLAGGVRTAARGLCCRLGSRPCRRAPEHLVRTPVEHLDLLVAADECDPAEPGELGAGLRPASTDRLANRALRSGVTGTPAAWSTWPKAATTSRKQVSHGAHRTQASPARPSHVVVLAVLQHRAEGRLDRRPHRGVATPSSARGVHPVDRLRDAGRLLHVEPPQPLHGAGHLGGEVALASGTRRARWRRPRQRRVVDPVVQAAALERVVQVAGAVRREHDDRRMRGRQRADLGDRDASTPRAARRGTPRTPRRRGRPRR